MLLAAVEALLAGATLGAPSGEVPAAAAQVTPPPAPPVVVAASPLEAEPADDQPERERVPWDLRVAILYEIGALGHEPGVTHGPLVAAALRSPWPLSLGGLLSVQYRFPLEIEADPVGARSQTLALRALATIEHPLSARVALRFGLGAGADVVRLTPQLEAGTRIQATDARTLALAVARVLVNLDVTLTRTFALWFAVATDVDLDRSQYVLIDENVDDRRWPTMALAAGVLSELRCHEIARADPIALLAACSPASKRSATCSTASATRALRRTARSISPPTRTCLGMAARLSRALAQRVCRRASRSCRSAYGCRALRTQSAIATSHQPLRRLMGGPRDVQLDLLAESNVTTLCGQAGVWQSRLDDAAMSGWLIESSPDNAQELDDGSYGPCIEPEVTQAEYADMVRADDSRPVMLLFGQGVADAEWPGRGSCDGRDDMYPEYVKAADMLGFYYYPVSRARPLELIATGVDRLLEWSRHQKPVLVIIEAASIDGGVRPTPEEVREAWLALVRGAAGIAYYCHRFMPDFSETDCLEEGGTREAMARVNAEIGELAPALNSPMVSNGVTVTSEAPFATRLARVSGATYLIAVALSNDAGRASFTLRGFGDAVAEVIGEDREVAIESGDFADDFAGYGVHLYRIAH